MQERIQITGVEETFEDDEATFSRMPKWFKQSILQETLEEDKGQLWSYG